MKKLLLSVVDGALIDRAEGRLICYPQALKSKSFTVPEGVKTISGYAFEKCNIKEIILPEGVEKIEDYAFIDCDKTDLFVLPESLKAIDRYAIYSSGQYWNISPNKNRKIIVVRDSYAADALMEAYRGILRYAN